MLLPGMAPSGSVQALIRESCRSQYGRLCKQGSLADPGGRHCCVTYGGLAKKSALPHFFLEELPSAPWFLRSRNAGMPLIFSSTTQPKAASPTSSDSSSVASDPTGLTLVTCFTHQASLPSQVLRFRPTVALDLSGTLSAMLKPWRMRLPEHPPGKGALDIFTIAPRKGVSGSPSLRNTPLEPEL